MKKTYPYVRPVFYGATFLLLIFSACKKDKGSPGPINANPVTLGLYEYGSNGSARIFIPISKVGTQTVNYYGVFDTGSTGMTIDANGILPASMITKTGLQVTGDSVSVNGITVTSQTLELDYGNLTSLTKVYGNLAYAPVQIGDANGSLKISRVAFFLYYKITDGNGNQLTAHSLDAFGVGPGVSYSNSSIASPLSYYSPGTGLTSGFKLALLNASQFISSGPFVAGLLTIGLTPADLTSNGFVMHSLTNNGLQNGGYSPDIPAMITYNGVTINGTLLFDTGTPSTTLIENANVKTATQLPANTMVTVTTNPGFTYTYTTNSTTNLTTIENPAITGDFRTIFSIYFFTSNEFLTDYTNHRIGLKNN
jgi:hypothetical protein